MRKASIILFVIVMILTTALATFALTSEDGTKLSGAHYNLNIIGVQNPKTAVMDSSNGHVIFVPMEGKSQINLMEVPEGEDFKVLDGNATDGPAAFQLPKPGLDPYLIGGDMTDVDTMSDYSVFVRPLGKPGGWSTITTCADLMDSTFAGLLPGTFVKALNRAGEFGGFASVEQVGQEITMRTKGKTQFTNVTAELLTIVFQVEVLIGDVTEVVYVRVPIFDDILANEYWEYDNNNLKLLQIRFYPIGTDVTYNDLLYAE